MFKLKFRDKHFLIVLMALLQVGDLLSTHRALAHGAVELNPFLQSWPAIVAAKAISVVIFGYLVSRTNRLMTAVLLCGLFSVIVWSNWICV